MFQGIWKYMLKYNVWPNAYTWMRVQSGSMRVHNRSIQVAVGARGHSPPPNLAQASQIFRVITVHKLVNTGQLDTVVLLVVASQMMRGQPPSILF